MRIRIYQINPERDASRSMFRSYDENRTINPSEYDNVFDPVLAICLYVSYIKMETKSERQASKWKRNMRI